MDNKAIDVLYAGRFIELVSLSGWEYARRSNATGVAAILPVHTDGRLVLIEQVRPAAGGPVIEWPAGLVGDEGDAESHLDAAKRELLEETGYEAKVWELVGEGMSSAGLTDEAIVFYLAKDLMPSTEGGGVGGENITKHEILPDELTGWIEEMKRVGKKLDLKVYAGLGMLNQDTKEDQDGS
ncbi:MAG: NUDIX hydrolase [Phycisphaerales bacterium JB063]